MAQGGDWGDMVTELMATHTPPELVGIHTNMPATLSPQISKALSSGGPPPAGLSADEMRAWEQLKDFFGKHAAYSSEMGNRPQTLYGLSDSPIGLAGWILDHDKLSYELIARVLRRKARRTDARRHSRQHHDVLAHEHRRLIGSAVLG